MAIPMLPGFTHSLNRKRSESLLSETQLKTISKNEYENDEYSNLEFINSHKMTLSTRKAIIARPRAGSNLDLSYPGNKDSYGKVKLLQIQYPRI